MFTGFRRGRKERGRAMTGIIRPKNAAFKLLSKEWKNCCAVVAKNPRSINKAMRYRNKTMDAAARWAFFLNLNLLNALGQPSLITCGN